MKKEFFIIIVAFLLTSCIGNASTEEEKEKAIILKNGEWISLPQYNIKLIKPKEWETTEREGAFVLHDDCAKSVDFCPNIAILGKPFPKGEKVDVKEYTSAYINKLHDAYPTVKLTGMEEKTIDGKPAFTIKYMIEARKMQLVGSSTFVQIDEILFSMSYMAPETQKDKNSVDYAAIFETVSTSIKEKD